MDRVAAQVAAPELPSPAAATSASAGGIIAVGIDFGTTFSGVAYSSARHFGQDVQLVLDWPGTSENFRKIPTCITYRAVSDAMTGRKQPEVVAWGVEAKQTPLREGDYRCEFFKLYLAPEGARKAQHLPPLPPGKTPADVIADFLSLLWKHAKAEITKKTGSVAEVEGATVVLTVPSAWNAAGCAVMRRAALQADLVKNTNAFDSRWRDRLHIITEPEAAAVHGVAGSQDPVFQPPRTFVVCDAGGGTVDCAAYRISSRRGKIAELAEVTVRSGANCGSLFLDQNFESLIRKQLKLHERHLDSASRQSFLTTFVDVDKVSYSGEDFATEPSYVYDCWHQEDKFDSSAGLFGGELYVSASKMHDVFAPVIDEAVNVVNKQLAKLTGERVSAVLLVGGFSGSTYLFNELNRQLAPQQIKVVRPQDADIATVQGAAQYGRELQEGALSVVNVICPRSYMLETKVTAEPEDELARPAYITTNPDGRRVCDQRLMYLTVKGSIFRKGQRVTKLFRKRTDSPTDSLFTAHLKASDDAAVHRYSDQAASHDFCSWTVDLKDFPPFCKHWATVGSPGYVPFVIGLEMDSAEVRGLLLDEQGTVWGSATFEYME